MIIFGGMFLGNVFEYGLYYIKILEDSERDYFMNPEEACKYGLIDKIAQQPSKPA